LKNWTLVTTEELEKLIGSAPCQLSAVSSTLCQHGLLRTGGIAVSIRYVTVQQVTGCRLHSIRLEESCGLSTAQESRI